MDIVAARQDEPRPKRRKANVIDLETGEIQVNETDDENFVDEEPEKARAETRDQQDPENLRRAASRARAAMKRKIMMLGGDRLLTMTIRRNVTDLDEAWKLFHRAIRILRRLWPDWAYVAVPEQQKRGCWHFHLAINGFRDVRILRHVWCSVLGGKGEGNVDITSPRKGGQWKRAHLAAYLGKYMAKAGEALAVSRRRYSSSKNIPEPVLVRAWLPAGDQPAHLVTEIIRYLTGQLPTRSMYSRDGPAPVYWAASY